MKTENFPPILLDFSPKGEELYGQIQDNFLETIHRIADPLPNFKLENGIFVTTLRSNGTKIGLTDENAMNLERRRQLSGMAIGDYWELMNVVDLLFHWNKVKDAKLIFKFETTHFKAEFTNANHAVTFLFDMEERWTDWLKELH